MKCLGEFDISQVPSHRELKFYTYMATAGCESDIVLGSANNTILTTVMPSIHLADESVFVVVGSKER